MRRPRVRLTVRRLIVLVAILALGLFVAREFQDGSPPRSVVAGIPARIARLRPGMTWQETADILGLERPWYRGGISARFSQGGASSRRCDESYLVRPYRVERPRLKPGEPMPTSLRGITAGEIRIVFRCGRLRPDDWPGWHKRPDARLVRAEFLRDNRVIARMPASE